MRSVNPYYVAGAIEVAIIAVAVAVFASITAAATLTAVALTLVLLGALAFGERSTKSGGEVETAPTSKKGHPILIGIGCGFAGLVAIILAFAFDLANIGLGVVVVLGLLSVIAAGLISRARQHSGSAPFESVFVAAVTLLVLLGILLVLIGWALSTSDWGDMMMG
jgi:hypothetical protein